MNEEEINNSIELLKKAVNDYHKTSEHFYYFDEYQMSTLRQLTFQLADRLNEEKEKNKKLEEEKEAFRKSYEAVMGEKADDYFLMSKVIDLMLDDMLPKNFICSQQLQDKLFGEQYYDKVKNAQKEYYFKKARGE